MLSSLDESSSELELPSLLSLLIEPESELEGDDEEEEARDRARWAGLTDEVG